MPYYFKNGDLPHLKVEFVRNVLLACTVSFGLISAHLFSRTLDSWTYGGRGAQKIFS